MTTPALDAPQTNAEKSPERQQQATELSRDVQSQFKPGDNTFKPGDQTKLNSELKGFGFPDVQVGNDSHLQDHGKDVQNTKYDNGNLTYDRTDPSGEKQHVTLNMSDHPGLETVQNVKAQLTQTTETDAQGKQHTTDFAYDASGKLTSAKMDGKEILPADAKDAKVDSKTGQLSYTSQGADGATKTTTMNPDGTAVTGDGTTNPGDRPSFAVGDNNGAPVNRPDFRDPGDGTTVWCPPGHNPISMPKDADINGKNSPEPTVDERGHLIYSTLYGDKVDVDADGNEKRTLKDGGTEIDRNNKGEVTGYHNPASGAPQFENGKWTGLPGVKDGEQPKNVNVSDDGSMSYTTNKGIKIDLDSKGQAISYESNDYSIYRNASTGQWIYNQLGSGTDVPVDAPHINDDGSVSALEHRLGDISNVTHTLDGTGANGSTDFDWSKAYEKLKEAKELIEHPAEAVDKLRELGKKMEEQLLQTGVLTEDQLKNLEHLSAADRAATVFSGPAAVAIGVIDLLDGLDKFDAAKTPEEYVKASAIITQGTSEMVGGAATTAGLFTGNPIIAAAGEFSSSLALVISTGVSIYDLINKK